MRQRHAIDRPPGSRAFVDGALAELRRSRWRPAAWALFLRRCGVRSLRQAREHPLAALEVTALHLALLAARSGSRLRLGASWALAMTHLGLLGPDRRSIGPPSALSLLRANLPAGRWSPPVAIATDLADGWLARRTTPTAFGAYADGLADVAFWVRQVWAGESNPFVRAAACAAWLLPLSAIGAAYFVTGRTVDHPRPVLARGLSAGLQALLAARAVAGRFAGGS
jgi:hypothetical protein